MDRVGVRTLHSAFGAALVLSFGCGGDSTDPMADQRWAISFDGTEDYVTVPHQSPLDVTTAATVQAWFYFQGGVSGYAGVVQKDGPSSYGIYGLWAFSDQIEFCITIDGDGQHCLDSTGGLTMNAWNHVAGVYDGSFMRIYLDGSEDASQALSGAILTGPLPLYIGGDPTEPTYLPGRLDEVAVWSVARSEVQIQASMSAGLTGSESNLVGYWPMDDGGGQVVEDASPNHLDATLGSTIGAQSTDPTWTMTTWPH